MIHFVAGSTTACGISIRPFLSRTAWPREVSCPECLKAVCRHCRGWGTVKVNGTYFKRAEMVNGKAEIEMNDCPVCKGSRLNLW